MTARGANLSVLIVCPGRADRRTIFDAMDRLEMETLYSAKNLDQASEFLRQVQISVLVLHLGFDPAAVELLLDEYFQNPTGRLLAILPSEKSPRHGWSWEFMPKRTNECVQSPVQLDEVVHRVRKMLASLPNKSTVEDDDSDLLFDTVDDGYVLSDPQTGLIIRVNSTFLEWTGDEELDWIGIEQTSLPIAESADGWASHADALNRDGSVSFISEFRRNDRTTCPVLIRQDLGMFAGQVVYFTRFRDIHREMWLDKGHRLLGDLFTRGRPIGSDDLAEIAENWLDLDHFMVATVDRNREIQVVAALSRRAGANEYLTMEAHWPIARIMQGDEIVIADDAGTVIGNDRFVSGNDIKSYIGLPIMARSKRVTGLVIGARQEPTNDRDINVMVSALRVLGGRLGLRWELKMLDARNQTQGLHDSLTGLPNRMLFHDRLDLALREGHRSGEMVALMFVDLDRFKTINDSLGHAVGDEVLVSVAKRLREGVRGSDTVARYAGDEFTLVLRHVNEKHDVMRIANKLNTLLAAPLILADGRELQMTASIGISFFPDDGRSADELMRHADMAMYGAKGMGRNTSQNYVEQPEDGQAQKLQLESKLRRAEKNDELRVFYQPQVSTETEDIVGMEALIRWEHPELGLISPGFFIPLAEETGLIVPIGEWLLRKATQETAQWHRRFGLPLTLGVNLSPLQLKQPNLLEIVEQALNQADLDPRFLDLEVTESLSIKSIPGLKERLESLRELGCRISIDDFGTGQASLDYLKRFPADRIKIDQSFVRNIGVDPDDEAIVKATINMAHSLKMGVIAEGVEEEDHLEFLRDNGCEELQGYLFCRPIPADTFSQLLVDREKLTSSSDAA